jgi:hypothetical protein
LRGANVRVEQRLDRTLAVRHGDRYLPIAECALREKANKDLSSKPKTKRQALRRGSDWNKNFNLKKGPKVWQAAKKSGCRSEANG